MTRSTEKDSFFATALKLFFFAIASLAERQALTRLADFTASGALDYVPLFRFRAGVNGQNVYRPGWTNRLDPTHLAFIQHLDGERSIREIAAKVAQSGLVNADEAELQAIGLELFEGLWRSDFLAIDLSPR